MEFLHTLNFSTLKFRQEPKNQINKFTLKTNQTDNLYNS